MAITRKPQWIYSSDSRNFARAVAADNDTVIAGAPNGIIGTGYLGRAYVYRKSALGVWELEQELSPSVDDANSWFGYDVALSGNTAFVSSPQLANGGTKIGSVYVFTRSGTTWTEVQKIDGVGGDYQMFGVAIASDGARLVILDHDMTEATYGDAYIYTVASNGTCTHEQTVTPFPRAIWGARKESVAIDGSTVAFGAYVETLTHCACVYLLDTGTWAEQQQLLSGANKNVGYVVEVSGDLLFTGREYHVYDYGNVRSWRRTGTTWAIEQEILASDRTRNQAFGISIRVNSTGDGLLIGTIQTDESGTNLDWPGSVVYEFENKTGTWTELFHYGWSWTGQSPPVEDAPGFVSQNADNFGRCLDWDDANDLLVIGADPTGTTYHGGLKFYGPWESEQGVGLDEPTGRHYNLFLKIDGLEPILWQYSHHGTPVRGWTRSFKTCLHAGSEVALDLDLGEMRSGMSAMTFALDDVPDDTSGSYFAKLFGPARYLTSTERCWIAPGTAPGQQIDADATTITVDGGDNLTTVPGEFHLGQENIYVSASAETSLTGVVRGRYPCVGDNWASTYTRPQDDEEGYRQQISYYPYSWIGRRVALYVTAWDDIAEDWCPESESVLVWTGRISDRIVNRARTRRWELSCTSIFEEMATKKICVDMPTTTLEGINLQGAAGRVFRISIDDDDPAEIVIPAGWYPNGSDLADAVNQAIYAVLTSVSTADIMVLLNADESFSLVYVAGAGGRRFEVDSSPYGVPCHAMAALGFPSTGKHFARWGGNTTWGLSGKTELWSIIDGEQPYTAYHPLHTNINGSRLYASQPEALWADQGDDSSASASLSIAGAKFWPGGGNEGDGTYLARYSARDSSYFTILETYNAGFGYSGVVDFGAYVGQRVNEAPKDVTQVYVPTYLTQTFRKRGPFELLLFPLLSTGTEDYNDSTYDKLPPALSVAVQADLVDTDSFLRADAELLHNKLAHRKLYVIDEAISWLDLVGRECKLFGYAVVWSDSKLTLVNMVAPDYDKASTVISESVRAGDDWMDSDAGIDTVVNQYECNVMYDPALGKYVGPKLIISDVNSITGLQTVKSVTLEHPGVYWTAQDAEPVKDALGRFLKSRWLALPSPVVRASLNHTKLAGNDRVDVGKVVRFESTRTPDPRGDGTYQTYCLATVLGLAWRYDAHLYTGVATLLLHGGMVTGSSGLTGQWWVDVPNKPWAACAEATAWDAVNLRLTLAATTFGRSGTDQDDGVRFEAGYFVNVIERAPADPAAPQTWGPLEVDSDYETDGAGLLTLVAGSALAGWVTGREYIVVPADRGDCISNQKLFNTFQASVRTRLLEGTYAADQYT